jgi:uncharacterized protein YxeA
MDTIIIGLILFIIVISATIFYDKYKDDVIAILKHQRAKYKPRQESAKRSNVALEAQRIFNKINEKHQVKFKKKYDETSSNEEFLKQFKASVKNNQKALGRETDGSIEDADEQSPIPKKKKTVRRAKKTVRRAKPSPKE